MQGREGKSEVKLKCHMWTSTVTLWAARGLIMCQGQCAWGQLSLVGLNTKVTLKKSLDTSFYSEHSSGIEFLVLCQQKEKITVNKVYDLFIYIYINWLFGKIKLWYWLTICRRVMTLQFFERRVTSFMLVSSITCLWHHTAFLHYYCFRCVFEMV